MRKRLSVGVRTKMPRVLNRGALISVIIPAYNEQKNIKRLLLSIANQTYKNVESIVVDDNSIDETFEIAKQYASKAYKRPHQERSIQRNFGASKASGTYYLFLDADMELTSRVIESCIENLGGHKALIIPEKTVGKGYLTKIRAFEREMYMGDPEIEVARFFDAKVFKEFNGYDPKLTGTEDYDLPKRITAKYTIGWAKEYILHHEESRSLFTALRKKFYYAQKSAYYADKHPDLIPTQGNLLFRKAYFRNWKKFVDHPFVGTLFIFIRILETFAAVFGYIRTVGLLKFTKTFFIMFNKGKLHV